MARRPTAWVDLVSPSHPFFFRSLIDALPSLDTNVTVREKTETVGLAGEVGFDYTRLGRDFDNTLLRKMGIPLRTLQLVAQAPSADVSLSSRNAMCILASKARGIPSIHFTDNDITAHVDRLAFEELYNRLEAQATYNVVPSAFETEELIKWGADSEQIIKYDGYKEDIYIADFEPDSTFTDRLPFDDNFVVLRPEALSAAYVDSEASLVPQLLQRLVKSGTHIIYLPRGRGDQHYASKYESDQVFMPEKALDGLQLAWHADCTMTGSGTMAREAACMNKPAVSFFPNTPLSVDQRMIEENRVFHSRQVDDLVDYVLGLSEQDIEPDNTRSKEVNQEVCCLTQNLITQCANKA